MTIIFSISSAGIISTTRIIITATIRYSSVYPSRKSRGLSSVSPWIILDHQRHVDNLGVFTILVISLYHWFIFPHRPRPFCVEVWNPWGGKVGLERGSKRTNRPTPQLCSSILSKMPSFHRCSNLCR